MSCSTLLVSPTNHVLIFLQLSRALPLSLRFCFYPCVSVDLRAAYELASPHPPPLTHRCHRALAVPGAKSAEMVDHVEKAILSLGCRAVDGCMTRRIERL